MLNIKVTLTGGKDLIAKLRRLDKDFDNWEDAFKKIGNDLKGYYQDQVFTSEGAIFGMQWPRLNKFYDFWKRKTYGAVGILVRTGEMQKGVQVKTSKDSLEVFNSTPYAIFHQLGTRKMPKRVLFHVDSKLENKIANTFSDEVKDKLKKVFG